MPSSAPTLANNFQVTGSDNLDEVLWNAVFAEIASLLKGLSDTFQTLEELEQSTINQSLAVIAQSVEPQVLALQQAVALAQAQVDTLILTGVAAGSVSVSSIDGLDATTVQAALAELLGDLVALATVVTGLGTDLTTFKAGAFTVVDANTTAVDGDDLFVTTTGGARTITLPAEPAIKNRVRVWRYGENLVSLDPGDKSIGELAEVMNIDADKVRVVATYDGTTWRVTGEYFA